MSFFKLQWFFVASIMTILQADGYDPLDPHGSINIRWDIMSWTPDGYVAEVSIKNNQMYRQIRRPGWRLGWKWSKKEVIWSMVGAEATDQGDCSSFKTNIPHSCMRNPEIVDLLPGAPMTQQFRECCKAGIMASSLWGQHPSADDVSSFQLSVGKSGTTNRTVKPPKDFYLLAPGPGYTCSAPSTVSPSVFFTPNGRRKTRAMMTWVLSCTYSQVIASKYPSCCVSLSSFYNSKITSCPSCACGCHEDANCARNDGKIESVVNSKGEKLECTEHMCPIRVHWHVKQNYKLYWVVKITITNLNYGMNYTQWTLVAQHPNLNNLTKLYKFMYKPLMHFYNPTNDTGMFYGIKYYNDVLPEAGKDGNVQSEMLFQKDTGRFTLNQGWPFPSKIYFNGDECVMPPPNSFPFLPNSAPSSSSILFLIFIFLAFHFTLSVQGYL